MTQLVRFNLPQHRGTGFTDVVLINPAQVVAAEKSRAPDMSILRLPGGLAYEVSGSLDDVLARLTA